MKNLIIVGFILVSLLTFGCSSEQKNDEEETLINNYSTNESIANNENKAVKNKSKINTEINITNNIKIVNNLNSKAVNGAGVMRYYNAITQQFIYPDIDGYDRDANPCPDSILNHHTVELFNSVDVKELVKKDLEIFEAIKGYDVDLFNYYFTYYFEKIATDNSLYIILDDQSLTVKGQALALAVQNIESSDLLNSTPNSNKVKKTYITSLAELLNERKTKDINYDDYYKMIDGVRNKKTVVKEEPKASKEEPKTNKEDVIEFKEPVMAEEEIPDMIETEDICTGCDASAFGGDQGLIYYLQHSIDKFGDNVVDDYRNGNFMNLCNHCRKVADNFFIGLQY